MDEELLNSCSDRIKPAVKHLNSSASAVDRMNRLNAMIFYVLDQVKSNRVPEFIEYWHERDYDPGLMVFEEIDNLVYLLKLEKKYNPKSWEQHEGLRQFAAILKSEQTVDGAFKISDFDNVGGLWFMTHYAPDAEVTKNAVDYFISNFDQNSPQSRAYWQDISLGSIALSELDFHYYNDVLREYGEEIKQNLPKRLEEYRKNRTDGDESPTFKNQLHYILIALNRIPNNYPDICESIAQILRNRLSRQSLDKISNRKIARIAVGLIANGEGSKIAASTADWEKEREIQRFRKSRPQFVSTLPTTQLETRRREIYNRSKNIIDKVDKELRISTLRIDLLYDEIIELVHETDVDVKILSRPESPSDDRKRIKKAVINELVKETTDEVRGDNLIHARMIIGDKDEMLVSSADLTRDQLYDQFNAGIYTRDNQSISEAIEVFDKIWSEADPIDIIR